MALIKGSLYFDAVNRTVVQILNLVDADPDFFVIATPGIPGTQKIAASALSIGIGTELTPVTPVGRVPPGGGWGFHVGNACQDAVTRLTGVVQAFYTDGGTREFVQCRTSANVTFISEIGEAYNVGKEIPIVPKPVPYLSSGPGVMLWYPELMRLTRRMYTEGTLGVDSIESEIGWPFNPTPFSALSFLGGTPFADILMGVNDATGFSNSFLPGEIIYDRGTDGEADNRVGTQRSGVVRRFWQGQGSGYYYYEVATTNAAGVASSAFLIQDTSAFITPSPLQG